MAYRKKGDRAKKRKARAQGGSFMTRDLKKKADEARKLARGGNCGCANGQPCPHTDTWIKRAEKLEAVRGDIAMGLWNLQSSPDFWRAVDHVKVNQRPKKLKTPKSNNGVSLRQGLRGLREKARQKALDACTCAPWDECHHDPKRDGGVWSDRLRKLSTLSIETATALLPHLGKSSVWEAVDALDEVPVVRRTSSPPRPALGSANGSSQAAP